MNIMFEKKIWFEAKAKLQRLFDFLTERDFQYKPGEECKVPERIRKILRMPVQEFYRLTGLTRHKRHHESPTPSLSIDAIVNNE